MTCEMALRIYAIIITLAVIAALTNPPAERHYEAIAGVYPSQYGPSLFAENTTPLRDNETDPPPTLLRYSNFRLFSSMDVVPSDCPCGEPDPFTTISRGVLGYVFVRNLPDKPYQYTESEPVTEREHSGPESDPAADFFTAYRNYREAEKLTRDGRAGDATEMFGRVLTQLEQIKARAPSWQPMVVDFRIKKTREYLEKSPEKQP
jgi:hypothetical protein